MSTFEIESERLYNVIFWKLQQWYDYGRVGPDKVEMLREEPENPEYAENWEKAKHGWVPYYDGEDDSLVTLNPDVFFAGPKKKITRTKTKHLSQWIYPSNNKRKVDK